MTVCCIKHCCNTWKNGHSMHQLPTNVKKRERWITNIARPDLDPAKKYYVCDVSCNSFFLFNTLPATAIQAHYARGAIVNSQQQDQV